MDFDWRWPKQGSAEKLDFLEDDSIDLVIAGQSGDQLSMRQAVDRKVTHEDCINTSP